jgi:hypothetical protein
MVEQQKKRHDMAGSTGKAPRFTPAQKHLNEHGSPPSKTSQARTDRWGALWEAKVFELRERVLFILEHWESGRGKYGHYESVTGIPASRWQNMCLGKQLPTLDMVMAIAQRNPWVAEWLLAVGTADERVLENYGGIEAWHLFQKERALQEEYQQLKNSRIKRA